MNHKDLIHQLDSTAIEWSQFYFMSKNPKKNPLGRNPFKLWLDDS